jgi:acyl transferase domain-containing protein
MDRCDEILRPIMGRRIVELIYPAPGVESPIDDTTFAQPALFALEWAVCEMWKSWGIEPDFVIGHSAGEDVAACVAASSPSRTARLIAERGAMGVFPGRIGDRHPRRRGAGAGGGRSLPRRSVDRDRGRNG